MSLNGYFSFGREIQLPSPVLFPESVLYNHLVAPFWTNYNQTQSGSISYEVHSTATGLTSIVNNFIRQEGEEDFLGTWMMVATFNELSLLDSTAYEVMVLPSMLLIILLSPNIFLDKHLPGDHHHQWESVLWCVHLPLWLSNWQWQHRQWNHWFQL